eukprot:UN08046
MYHKARPYINQTILEVSKPVSATDYLYYFYFAGVAHIAAKNFSKALDHLAMCNIVPGGYSEFNSNRRT